MPRIPNHELEYYENVIAASAGIAQECRRLAYLVGDDPDVLEPVLRILQRSQRIRKSTIGRMNGRKEKG